MTFDAWFEKATCNAPFPYQVALATGAALPDQLSVPTGLGKTAAAVLSWLWRRRFAPEAIRTSTPRRLVFCLPVRTLVEQTLGEVDKWLARLGVPDVPVYQLMGGAVSDAWDAQPDVDAILVGTQDQLISRALNRGYGMSRFRWPMHFAWLNNDALWVFDEVQLMGVGASTGAQLQGLRDRLGTARPTHTIWMTATPSPGRLATIDGTWPLRAQVLSDDDRAHPVASARLNSRKRLVVTAHDPTLDRPRWPGEIAKHVLAHHVTGGRTLVVVNQVARAQAVYTLLKKGAAEVRLLHSRFRAVDRARAQRAALDPDFRGVIVATQAIEAGVDLTCSTLVTEACPWASFVQRVGRCNRYGEEPAATVVWLGLPTDEKACAPYTPGDVQEATGRLAGLVDVGPNALASLAPPDGEPLTPVLRRRDLLGLFDTETDLSGMDVDVSGYIRDTDDADVSVAWRAFDADVGPSPSEAAVERDELCRVRVGRLKELLKKTRAWRWDSLDGGWRRVDGNRVTPGMTVVLPTSAGGYSADLGYTGEPGDRVDAIRTPGDPLVHDDADSGDPLTLTGDFVTLTTHSDDTAGALAELASRLSDAASTPWAALERAARWHDVGKAHPVFQSMLTARLPDADPRRSGGPWAKSDGSVGSRAVRPHFRHELASALAFLGQGATDLEAYVVAAHHGKARLTVRSRPTERPHPARGKPILGVLDGDVLPAVDLGAGHGSVETELRLELFTLGGGDAGRSWMSRTQALLADMGPFRLAWCEALVRVADWEASAKRRTGLARSAGGAN